MFELTLPNNLKENIKGFWLYLYSSSQMNMMPGVEHLCAKSRPGDLVFLITDNKKAEVMNYFNFLFLQLGVPIPLNLGYNLHVTHANEQWTCQAESVTGDPDNTPNLVSKKMTKTRPTSASGPDRLPPSPPTPILHEAEYTTSD